MTDAKTLIKNNLRKAAKPQQKVKLALCGYEGSGKSYTALSIAAGLGPKVAAIDTEHNRLTYYAKQFEFDHLDLQDCSPATLAELLKELSQTHDVIIIDSLSKSWRDGQNCALELVDRYSEEAAAPGRTPNKFGSGWKVVTPMWRNLVATINCVPAHVIVTLRSETQFVLVGGNIKRRNGAVVIRDGFLYDIPLVMSLEEDHTIAVTKSACNGMTQGAFIPLPDRRLGERLLRWYQEGTTDITDLVQVPEDTTKLF